MYEAFFGMIHTPFTRDLPPECLYETKAMRDVLGRLMYVADKKLFAVITSEPGCGKSTLLRKFDAMLPKDEYILLYLSDSKLTPKWFYKGLLEQLGIDSGFYRGDAKRQLQASIEIIQGVQKKRVVCILDEAHLLDKEMLEEFRFMLNYKFDSESPMALVLAGQTELWDRKLKLQRYAAIRQRIDRPGGMRGLHQCAHAVRGLHAEHIYRLGHRSDLPDLERCSTDGEPCLRKEPDVCQSDTEATDR